MSNRREYRPPGPEQVGTPFGTMWIHHLFGTGHRTVRIDCTDGSSVVPVVVNCVDVIAALTLTDYGDGNGFVPHRDNDTGNDSYALHVGRADRLTTDASWAAGGMLREALPAVVNEWARERGVDFARVALAAISDDVGRLQAELAGAEEKVEELRAEVMAQEAKLGSAVR